MDRHSHRLQSRCFEHLLRQSLLWQRPLWLAFLAFLGLFSLLPLMADDRSTVRLHYECSNELGRRDVTLFANGTVRVREGHWDDQTMFLTELGPVELGQTLAVLREIVEASNDPSVDLPGQGAQGAWIERCEILVALPDGEPRKLRFSKYDVPPLVVSRLIYFAEGLAELARPLDPLERLPESYKPRPGDILVKEGGERYEVIGLTADGRGVEVQALAEPLRIFYALGDLRNEFARVVGRDSR